MTCILLQLSAATRLSRERGAIDPEDRHDVVAEATAEAIRLLSGSQSLKTNVARTRLKRRWGSVRYYEVDVQ
jgi:hypothetical protein